MDDVWIGDYVEYSGEVCKVLEIGKNNKSLLRINRPETNTNVWVHSKHCIKASRPTYMKPSEIDGGPAEYYDFPESCNTLNDLIEHKEMSFAEGNIFKAIYRLGKKDGVSRRYDLNKIKYYADRMLAQLGEDE